MRALLVGSLSLACLFSAGCAERSAQKHIDYNAQSAYGPRIGDPRGRVAVLETPNTLVGPHTRLTRSEQGARGVLFGHLVDVQWDGDSMTGQIDGRPARLQVMQDGKATRVKGTIDERPVNVKIRGKDWTGRMGRCRVDLDRMRNGFAGSSSCTEFREPELAFNFPDQLNAAPLPEQVTYLALLVGTPFRTT